jgi:hypothetical protein
MTTSPTYVCDDPAPAGTGSRVAVGSGNTDGDIDYMTVVVAGWSVAWERVRAAHYDSAWPT